VRYRTAENGQSVIVYLNITERIPGEYAWTAPCNERFPRRYRVNGVCMSHEITDNLILGKLPPACLERLTPALEWVELRAGDIIPPDQVDGVYFPASGLMSFILSSQAGTSSEIAVAGREGFAGFSIFFGSRSPLIPAVVQRSGMALRLPRKTANLEFNRLTEFHYFLMAYFRMLFLQIAQRSLCNAQHPLEQRFCRWLLMCHDRLAANDHVVLSQEVIAGLLGVRREAISRVVKRLKSNHFIDYGTRRIEVIDRTGLMGVSCECYGALKAEYDRFTGHQYAGSPN